MAKGDKGSKTTELAAQLHNMVVKRGASMGWVAQTLGIHVDAATALLSGDTGDFSDDDLKRFVDTLEHA
jgi:hypothetical protein